MPDTRTAPTFPARAARRAALALGLAAAAACGHPRQPAPIGPCSSDPPSAYDAWSVQGGRVVGTVRDSAGAPVTPGRVLLTPLTRRGHFVAADLGPGGAFALDSVALGRYAAHVVGPTAYAPLDRTIRVAPGIDSVRIVLGHSAPCR
jgi:hypothetical protein